MLLFVNSVDGQEISTEPNQSDQTLTQLLDTVWEFELESSPFLATNVGDPRGQDRLSDDSLEAIQSRADQRARFLEKLNAIPAGKLSESRQIDRELLRQRLEGQLADLFEL